MNKIYIGMILVLLAIIVLQRECIPVKVKPVEPIILVDTVFKEVKLTETKTVPVYKTITKVLPGDTIFIPDTSYNKLKEQYIYISERYRSRNIHIDTVKIDTIGNVVVIDTIQYNVLKKRTYKHDYKIPTITKTIIKPAEKKGQLYIGFQLASHLKSYSFGNAQVSALYKNKNDIMFGVHYGIDGTEQTYLGFSTYWKIKLK